MAAVKETIEVKINQKVKSGDYTIAAELLVDSLEAMEGADRVPRLVQLAEVYRRLRVYPKARNMLNEAFSLAPNDVNVILEKAELDSTKKDWAEALTGWDKVLAHPTSIRPTYVQRRRDKVAGNLLSEELKISYDDIVRRRIENHQGYHSVWLGETTSKSVSRDGEERWEMIKGIIHKYDIKSYLDLGCAEGFYVRKAANEGCFSIGIDNNPDIFSLSQAAKGIEKEKNTGFVQQKIGAELFDTLPSFDMVVCLSVLHHVIRIEGLDAMKGYMKQIARIHNKAFLFDMGTSKEAGQKSELPDMGEKPEIWIEALLKECGFENIEMLGSTPSPNGVPRPFFLCRPNS